MGRNIFRRVLTHLSRYPGPWLSCFFGLLVLPFFTGHVPLVRFTEEEIRITVHPASIAVDAFYHYRNPFPFPVRQGYGLPFPEDGDHSPPAGIELLQRAPEERPIPVLYFLGKHRFAMDFPGGGNVVLHLHYEQATHRGRGTYILTSTQPWGRPLEKAAYRLIPEVVRIISSNYALIPDRSGAFSGHFFSGRRVGKDSGRQGLLARCSLSRRCGGDC